jgi:hypothetical protein
LLPPKRATAGTFCCDGLGPWLDLRVLGAWRWFRWAGYGCSDFLFPSNSWLLSSAYVLSYEIFPFTGLEVDVVGGGAEAASRAAIIALGSLS